MTLSTSVEDMKNLKQAINHIAKAEKLVEKINPHLDEIISEFLNMTLYGLKSIHFHVNSIYDIIESVHVDRDC